MDGLPEVVKRALYATVYLEGCSLEDAMRAAQAALHDLGDEWARTPKGWLDEIRDRLTRRPSSGTRPSRPQIDKPQSGT
jgi:hypothetical protein